MVANIQNLKVPTSEEAREYGRKGGLASGQARRKKKEDIQSAKTIVEALFAKKTKDKKGKKLTYKEAMIAKVFEKAIKDGSLTAINMLLSIAGENPNKPIIDISGFNITVADEKAREALEDL